MTGGKSHEKFNSNQKWKTLLFCKYWREILFESESLRECKEWLISYIKEHKEEMEENETYNYFIGMYNIDIED